MTTINNIAQTPMENASQATRSETVAVESLGAIRTRHPVVASIVHRMN